MPFKGITYLGLWQPFCSVERNHLCNFERGYPEDQFCKIILNFGPGCIQARLTAKFKDFSRTKFIFSRPYLIIILTLISLINLLLEHFYPFL